MSKLLYLFIIVALVGCSSSGNNFRFFASDKGKAIESRSAYDLWSELMEMSTGWNAKAINVVGTGKPVTFGAEKEASSSKLTRLMGLTGTQFKIAVGDLPPADRKAFLSDFMQKWVYGSYAIEFDEETGEEIDLADGVTDKDGKVRKIKMDEFQEVADYRELELDELEKYFKKFISQTDDNPWSFINGKVRKKMFLGTLPGIEDGFIGVNKKGKPHFEGWTALFGNAERFVDTVTPQDTNNGWEIQFKALNSFGEHEEMKDWFRAIMGDLDEFGEVELFQAPGHQWVVFPKPKGFSEAKFAEALKIVQAMIVVDGIKGRTGIDVAQFKNPHLDEDIINKDVIWGVIRSERNRFYKGSIGVELRAGTKDLRLVRFLEAALAARVASNDWGTMGFASKWTLLADELYWPEELMERFGVSEKVANRINKMLGDDSLEMGYRYIVPLWGWDDPNCPFVSEPKRAFLRTLTKNWLEQVAELPDNSNLSDNVRNLMQDWVKASGVSESMRQYFAPSGYVSEYSKLHHYRPKKSRTARTKPKAKQVDVNKMDFGIEYSGKFPLKYTIQDSDFLTSDEKVAWVRTVIDLNEEEREKMIEKIAGDLAWHLDAEAEVVKVEDASGHGHGLDVAFEIRDNKGRNWKVEWDGINRSYTSDGKLIEGSARGGSIELVTPKFQPNMDEMHAVFRAFSDNGIIPSLTTGGGHVNFDLSVFNGKPKEFARFLAIFHEHRSVIALMFQHVHRVRTSEPVNVSPKLLRELKNFNGTEEQLKRLLYNEGYFNKRVGRKTRYTHLDVSAYYQDIIPKEYLTQDFDISNPNEHWRRQFRVDPNIRKGEFRLFNAPRDAHESALQQKLVRAMLHKALNETDPIEGTVQNVKHEDYLADPARAFVDLKKMASDLGLNEKDYKVFVGEGLSETDLYTRSIFYKTIDEKMADFPVVKNWKKAVPKPRKRPLRSEDYKWEGRPDAEARLYRMRRRRSAREAEALRMEVVDKKVPIGKLYRKDSCQGALMELIEEAQ